MVELLDISVSRKQSLKPTVRHGVIRRFDDGTVELLLPNGLRVRRKPYNCLECGTEEVQHGLNGSSGRLIQSGLCQLCLHQELVRRDSALEQEREARRAGGLSGRMRRYVAQSLATPVWRDREAIAIVYIEAKRKTLETGVPHDVDHIYPIQSKFGCGLHVHWNLQIIERTKNISKGNAFPMHDSPALK